MAIVSSDMHAVLMNGIQQLFAEAHGPTMKLAYPKLPKSRDAGRWVNSSFTQSHQLFEALTHFIEQGWGDEALDEFIAGIVPVCGWAEDWKPHDMHQKYRRARSEYSSAVHAMMGGYWSPKEKK